MYQRIYLGADEKHQRDIQVAENNDDLNKTIQIFLREVGKNIEPRPFRKESFNRNDPLVDEILKNGLQLL